MPSSPDILSIATKLMLNGLRFRLLRAKRNPGRVKALSMEITHRCICRCIMCNIWKIPRRTPELSIQEWGALLADESFSGLVELDITGGEPFILNELPTLFEQLKEYKSKHLQRLRSVAITTNGVLTSRVLDNTKSILKTLAGTDIQLVLACAMDGFDDCHDQIRGLPGAFAKMQKTLRGLLALRTQNPSLILGIKTTIVPRNIEQLPAISSFARKHDLFPIISPCIITGGRFLNHDLASDLRFEQSHLEAIKRFLEKDGIEWGIHGRSLYRSLQQGRTHRQCSCGFYYAFIRSSGDVHLCPLVLPAIGSLKTKSFSGIWSSQQAKDLRNTIGSSEVCQHCTEPGLERYALVHEGWSYLALLFRMGPHRFQQLHSQLGLQNYF